MKFPQFSCVCGEKQKANKQVESGSNKAENEKKVNSFC